MGNGLQAGPDVRPPGLQTFQRKRRNGAMGMESMFNAIQEDDDAVDGERNDIDEGLAGEIGSTDEYTLMRSAAAAGEAIWPDDDDFMFLFSARYNSRAFRSGYLQAEYRVHIQHTFTGLVDGIIDRKLNQYKSNPFMYRKYSERLQATKMQADEVEARAALFGISLSKLDVGFLVHDVVAGLERLTDSLIDDHPDLTERGRRFAKRFISGQLNDDREQTLWRFVTSEKLSEMYKYDNIGVSVPLILGLDRMINEQFPPRGHDMGGDPNAMPYRDPAKWYIKDILGDDIISECEDMLAPGGDYDGMPADWAVSEVISKVEEPDPGW